jgi:AraC-like DNA-binding protein
MSARGTICTLDVSPRERTGLWQTSLLQLCGRLGAETQADGAFWGKIEHSSIGDISIAKVTASRHRIIRKPVLVRHDYKDFLKVVMQKRGTSCFTQGSRTVNLSPGEWCVYDATEPYCVSVPADTETLLALLPRKSLAASRIQVDDLLVRKFAGSSGIGKLALQFMESAFNEIADITPEAEWEIAGALTNLIRLNLLDASGIQTQISVRQIWRDRIKSYIIHHLRDPDLSIEQIAAALNCTKRYVHKVFEPETESISEWILRMRLNRCREDLCNPARSAASITDIAYSWGFNNPAHFSRAFKEEFQVSPRLCRGGVGALGATRESAQTKNRGMDAKLLRLRRGGISSYS